jgi:hypothetical protein
MAPYGRSDHLGQTRGHIINYHPYSGTNHDGDKKAHSLPSTEAAVAPKRRSAEEIAAIQETQRKLLAKYG